MAQLFSLGSIRTMKKYKIILVVLILVSLFALYSAVFFGWLTATPLSPVQLKRAEYDYYCWFSLFVISFLSGIAVTARMIWLRRKLRDKISV